MDTVLEKVVGDEQLKAILHKSPFYPIFGDDAELRLGSSQIGPNRNRFWRKDGRFVVDYHNNLMDIIGNEISGLGLVNATYKTEGDRIEAEGLIKACIPRLTKYLDENYWMYKSGKINPADKILDVDNLSIFEDIVTLMTKLSELPSTDLNNPNFIIKVMELTEAYIKIQNRYARKDGLPEAKP